MPTTSFLPLPDGLEIISISEAEKHLEIQILSKRPLCLCPNCSLPSQAIHSYYRRHPMELPCTGRVVRTVLVVKKFFCRNPECSRKVFTERIPELIEPSSRLTTRLRTLVQAMGIAFNANGGSRLGAQIMSHFGGCKIFCVSGQHKQGMMKKIERELPHDPGLVNYC